MTPPASAVQLATAIGSSRMTILPDAGHMLMTERPDAVIDYMRDVA